MSGASKVVHQDYIVKQRYHNTLPPPPGAPKLLKIPCDPMATYLSPFYTERMRRAEPMNIEADAFLGMPIDLVGIPGVFEGDEKAIQAPLNPPPIHPRDKILLRPLKALGKGGSEASDISFLRRTQYVANDDRSGRGTTMTSASGFNPAPVKRRRIDTSIEDAASILRSTIKGFNIANQASSASTSTSTSTSDPSIRGPPQPSKEELEAWSKPKHPSKPTLKLLDTYPLLPDLQAITNAPDGGFSIIKFMGQPTNTKTAHDPRLDTAFLSSIIDENVIQDYQTRLKQHLSNPNLNPCPQPPTINFSLFLAPDVETTTALTRKRNIHAPDRNSADLNTHHARGTPTTEPKDIIKLQHTRNYETGLQSEQSDRYQEVALALYDPEPEPEPNNKNSADSNAQAKVKVKGAYFYSLSSKIQLKPRRKIPTGHDADDDDEDIAHEMDLRFADVETDEVEGARREGISVGLEGGGMGVDGSQDKNKDRAEGGDDE